MKTLILIIISLFISMNIVLAQGELKINKSEIKLTNLKANDKEQTEIFQIENIGSQPILISRISMTGSQLKAEWSRAPLAPGKKRDISITFISKDLTENFDYKIIISSNAKNSRVELPFLGNLIDNPSKPGLLYRFSMNGLKFKTSHIGFKKVYTWQLVSDTVYFVNTLKKSVTLGIQDKPVYIGATFVPEKVKAGEKGAIIITYDAVSCNDYGYCFSSLLLTFNNNKSFRNRLSITANLVEDFTQLSENELSDAPVASFHREDMSFGEIRSGEKADCEFVLKNTGKRTLFIRKTNASCGCTAVALGEKAVAAGKSTIIRVTFDSEDVVGRQYKSITVTTNDPKSPEIKLTINGNVK